MNDRKGATRRSLELTGHSDSVTALAWCPHSDHPDLLATTSSDKSLRIWDARSGGLVHSHTLPSGGIHVAWGLHADDGGVDVGVGCRNDALVVIDMRTWKTRTQVHNDVEANEFCWGSVGSRARARQVVHVAMGTGQVRILDAESWRVLGHVTGHTSNCYSIAISPPSSLSSHHSQRHQHQHRALLAVGSADSVVSLWDLQDLICVRTLTSSQTNTPIKSLSFSHDGHFLAAGSDDPHIDLYAISHSSHHESLPLSASAKLESRVLSIPGTGRGMDGGVVHRIKTGARTTGLDWNPKRYLLAYAGDWRDRRDREDGSLRIWGFPASASN